MNARYDTSRTSMAIDGTRQRGMALVFALVVLLILTILGVSALRTSSLEQLMSGNIQDHTRAFEAADSGLDRSRNSMTDPRSFAPTTPAWPYTYANMNATANTQTPTLLGYAQAKASDTPTQYGRCKAFFDHQVTGSVAATFASSTLHQGLTADASQCPNANNP